MTKYYGIMPWDIGKLTLFQWQVYSEHIEKIYRIFHPEPKEKGSKRSSGGLGQESHKELKNIARRKGIKLPTKGM